MKRMIAGMAVAPLLWLTGTALALEPAPQSQPGFRWYYFPDSRQIDEAFPKVAADNEVEGSATLECVIVSSDGRVSCVVVSETPEMCGPQPDYAHPTKNFWGQTKGYPLLKDANGNPVEARCEFGKAAVTVVEKWGRADMAGGVPLGTVTKLTVRFQLM